MPDNDPIDVEIEIDLGFEPEPEPVVETKPEPEPVVETKPEPEPVVETKPEPEPEPAKLPEINITDASSLDFRKVGISTWKVKVKIGLVYDFSDIKTLRKYINDGRVTNEDVISHNGSDWTTLGDIPDLDAHFIDIYRHGLLEHPEALIAETEPLGERDELSEEAEALTNNILAQINQEVGNQASKTPVGPDFSDPFNALKKAQSSRGTQRKKMAKARKRHDGEMARQQRLGLIFLGILLVVFFVIKPFGSSEEGGSPAALEEDGANLDASSKSPAASGPSELELEMQAQLEAKLEKQKAARREEAKANSDEVQRRAVVPQEMLETPKGATGARIGTGGAFFLPATQRAKIAYRNGNYSVAVEAYKEALLQSNNKAKTRMGYGKALYRVGSDGPAIRELKKAERAGAVDEEAYRFLIDLLGRRGDDAGVNAYKQKLQALSQR